MRSLVYVLLATASLALASCSLLVDPNDHRLGAGIDGGSHPFDAHMDAPEDTGPTDAEPDSNVCDTPCADEFDCTIDSCTSGSCVHEADDSQCGPSERCSPSQGCVPRICEENSNCDDGLFCNGTETCSPGGEGADPETGCVDGTAVTCNDGFACTDDTCDEDTDACAYQANSSLCDDDVACTQDSCDPESGSANSDGCVFETDDSYCDTEYCIVGSYCDRTFGCVEGDTRNCSDGNSCTIDSCDEDINSCVADARDNDGDGYAPVTYHGTHCAGGTDCDDTDENVHPGATEYCNDVDDDCDGHVDDSCVTVPDDCDSAEEITLTGGEGSVTGVTDPLSDDFDTVCGDSDGVDAVYYIDLASSSDVVIDTEGSTFDTVLGASTVCTNDRLRRACNDDEGAAGTPSRIWAHRIGPTLVGSTRLYIMVDAYDSHESGSYTINVHVTAPALGAVCGDDVLDVTGGGTIVGVFPSAILSSGETGSCQTAMAPATEDIYSFYAPASGRVSVVGYTQGFAPILYMRHDDCSSGTEVDCANGSLVSGMIYGIDQDFDVTPGDLYYLFLDGSHAATTYGLQITPSP